MAMSCCSRAAWAGRGRAWRGLEGPGGAWKGSGLVTPGACAQQGLGGWRGRFLAGRDGPGVQLGGSGPRAIHQDPPGLAEATSPGEGPAGFGQFSTVTESSYLNSGLEDVRPRARGGRSSRPLGLSHHGGSRCKRKRKRSQVREEARGGRGPEPGLPSEGRALKTWSPPRGPTFLMPASSTPLAGTNPQWVDSGGTHSSHLHTTQGPITAPTSRAGGWSTG